VRYSEPMEDGARSIRRLTGDDAGQYRELRLLGLRSHPEAFGSAWENEANQTLEWFAERLVNNLVFGGWLGGPGLMGIAGLVMNQSAIQLHKAMVSGMFVHADARGQGLAAALLAHVIAEARPLVEELRLAVTASNAGAVRLYEAAGFQAYGVEPRCLKIGDAYHDTMFMALRL
jgi:GNAT superfamily N-acetyltransferase